MLSSLHATDVQFLFKNKPPRHDDFLLDDRQDGNVTLLSRRRYFAHHAPDNDALDHNVAVGKRLIDIHFTGARDTCRTHQRLARPLSDDKLLDVQRQRLRCPSVCKRRFAS